MSRKPVKKTPSESLKSALSPAENNLHFAKRMNVVNIGISKESQLHEILKPSEMLRTDGGIFMNEFGAFVEFPPRAVTRRTTVHCNCTSAFQRSESMQDMQIDSDNQRICGPSNLFFCQGAMRKPCAIFVPLTYTAARYYSFDKAQKIERTENPKAFKKPNLSSEESYWEQVKDFEVVQPLVHFSEWPETLIEQTDSSLVFQENRSLISENLGGPTWAPNPLLTYNHELNIDLNFTARKFNLTGGVVLLLDKLYHEIRLICEPRQVNEKIGPGGGVVFAPNIHPMVSLRVPKFALDKNDTYQEQPTAYYKMISTAENVNLNIKRTLGIFEFKFASGLKALKKPITFRLPKPNCMELLRRRDFYADLKLNPTGSSVSKAKNVEDKKAAEPILITYDSCLMKPCAISNKDRLFKSNLLLLKRSDNNPWQLLMCDFNVSPRAIEFMFDRVGRFALVETKSPILKMEQKSLSLTMSRMIPSLSFPIGAMFLFLKMTHASWILKLEVISRNQIEELLQIRAKQGFMPLTMFLYSPYDGAKYRLDGQDIPHLLLINGSVLRVNMPSDFVVKIPARDSSYMSQKLHVVDKARNMTKTKSQSQDPAQEELDSWSYSKSISGVSPTRKNSKSILDSSPGAGGKSGSEHTMKSISLRIEDLEVENSVTFEFDFEKFPLQQLIEKSQVK
ncbi:hypothetical protein Ciccas_007093 [Cichlidogyrus casuarinus]|uniref:Uncharacterized protein n=1 Tax=Cichlidogyrus casuarinus TaxID=1844966 RepID=A0ABD2Q6E9_9PLAT